MIVCMSTMVLTGCATQGVNSFNYTAPTFTQIKNEAVVQKPYSQVWDKLVKEISKSFYVINNIDKESRIINISFGTNTPADFVDCGYSHRTYTQGEKVDTFDYEVAGASQFKIAGNQKPHPSWASYAIVRREPSLEGRANIYIAPDDKDNTNTMTTINARYIWTIKTKGEMFNEHASGNTVSAGRIPEETSTISFNTNSKGEKDDGHGPKIVCISKGKLESEILGLITK